MESNLKDITRELRPLLAVFASLLVITVVAYPLAVTGIGQALFHRQANGSLVSISGADVGSGLIGQQFTNAAYFHPRPSAAGSGYDASSSSGSNLGSTSDKLINGVHDASNPSSDFDGLKDRAKAFRTENGLSEGTVLPADAATSSASGLDPHISPATARLQVERVAKARGVTSDKIRSLLDNYTEGRILGVFGEPRVNVLKLNLALDRQFPVAVSNPK